MTQQLFRRFYDNLPIYSRLADEIGLLQHFCDIGVQPPLDELHLSIKIILLAGLKLGFCLLYCLGSQSFQLK
jgi:hypothetical protein